MRSRLRTITILAIFTIVPGTAYLVANALSAAPPSGGRPMPNFPAKTSPAAKTAPSAKTPADTKTPTDPRASDAVEFRLKFPHDPATTVLEPFTWTVRNHIRQVGGPLTKPVDLTTQQSIDGTLQVLESGSEGATVEMVYTRVRFHMMLSNGRHVNFDSDPNAGAGNKPGRVGRPDKTAKFSPVTKPDDKPDEEVVGANKVYKALAGATLMLRFTASGKLQTVTGMDTVRERLLKLAGDEQESAAIRAMFADETVRSDLSELLTGFLPPGAMRIGQSWFVPTRRTVPGVGDTEWRLQHTLASVAGSSKEGTARIQITGEGQHDPAARAASPADTTGTPALPKLSDAEMIRTGSVDFDLKRGWLRSFKTRQTCRGNLPIGEGEPIQFSQDVDVSFTVTPPPEDQSGANSKAPAKP